MTTAWTGRTASDAAAAPREGRVSPREVLAEHLARIGRLDGRIGALRVVRSETALAEADEVAARAAAHPGGGLRSAVCGLRSAVW